MAMKVKVETKALTASLEKAIDQFTREDARGIVAAGANVIRDRARRNAVAMGFSMKGPHVYPGEGTKMRRGLIPQAIRAVVRADETLGVEAAVYMERGPKRGPTQVYHAKFLEHGTKSMPARPFFYRALSEAGAEAQAAMKRVFDARVGKLKV